MSTPTSFAGLVMKVVAVAATTVITAAIAFFAGPGQALGFLGLVVAALGGLRIIGEITDQ